MTRLLELVTTVKIEAVKRFVPGDHFKVDLSPEAVVRIGYLDDNFKRLLEKREENSPAVELKVQRLIEDSLDAPIIAELGDAVET